MKSVSFALFMAGLLGAAAQPSVTYNLDPAQVQSTASVGIHGQFLEHIFNSVHGGLWGDLVHNGSLEPNKTGESWRFGQTAVSSAGPITDEPLVFGSADWTDYEVVMEARKVGGAEGFLPMFRVAADGRHYWANLGGWSNREHAFEKNRTPLGARRAGVIETGRWYLIRIRCEGPQFSVWLDDQKVLEATDTANPVLKGAVGLNAWGTHVDYRNIKVTSLDGQKILFQGLPPVSTQAKAPPYWEFFGDGQFLLDTNKAFNDRTSVRIRRDEYTGVGGLKQGKIALTKGDQVSGVVHLRGIASSGLRVRILDSRGDTLFQKQLTLFGAKDWAKQTFRFVPQKSEPNAVLELTTDSLGDLCVDGVSLAPRSALQRGGFRADVLAAIQDLRPATIRYPGGCFASDYNWKHGIGPQAKRAYYPKVIWDDRDPNQMGTDEFLDLCRRVGAEPVLVVNINLPVQEALDWIEYCNGNETTVWGRERRRNGALAPYRVRYWEIDNETWHMGVAKYAEAVKKFSRAMRAKDPSIRIIACGGYGYDDGSPKDWNKGLIDRAARDFDYLSIHYYNGINYRQEYAEDPRRYEAYIRDELGALIRNSANTNLLVYCSEWGMMNDEWSSGLYTGGILNGFERQGELLTMACPAVWLQTVSETRPKPRWASCSILFDQSRSFGAPTYVVQKLWRDHFAPNILRLDGPDRPLNTVASVTDDGRTVFLKLVNPDPQPATVTVQLAPEWKVKTAALKLADPGSLEAKNTLAARPVAVREGEISLEGNRATFTLPGLSAGAATFTRRGR